MSGDHLERLAEYVAHLEETVARYGAGADEYVVTLNLNHDEGGTRDALHLADLRAALDELERLRAEREGFIRRLRHAYRSGWENRGDVMAKTLRDGTGSAAELRAEFYVKEWHSSLLPEADAAPQQSERGGEERQCSSHAHPDFVGDERIPCELPEGHVWHRNGERTWTP